MALGFCFGIALLLSAWLPVDTAHIPEGVRHMECRDGFFMVAVDLNFTGEEPRFEAVDGTGAYPITAQYSTECGYAVSVLPLQARVKLQASYASCHTDHKDENAFSFNFNLIANSSGEEVLYTFNKTCSVQSPRMISCDNDYMEVSVWSDIACQLGTLKEDGSAADKAALATSDWQVVFHGTEEQSMPMNLSEAHKQGYSFKLLGRRLVLRMPYGQPHSFRTEVNDVPVEVVHATLLFSRQRWVVLTIDLVTACSVYEVSYDDGYMVWKTPEVLHPLVSGVHGSQVNIGVDGELVEQTIAEERGYLVETHNATVEISITFNAEGGHRKSFVDGDLYELHTFNLCLEQTLVDEDDAETKVRVHRTMTTPLLPRPLFTNNQTALEEGLFTVYLGDVPEDVELTAVELNGHTFTAPFTNASGYNVTEVVHHNNTHGYTLTVLFDDPVVVQQFSKEDAAMKHMLDVNYTLMVLPDNGPYYHQMSVMALTDASPPAFEASCSESGVGFRLTHRPFDYLWYISIGSDRLTPELAARHNYTMINDSQSLLLEVPLFTHGYEYKNISLKRFLGTFEILVRDRETSEVRRSTVKTCPFTPTEFIMCSTDGRMTVVADLSYLQHGGIPARSNLIDIYCGPKEADNTSALFTFPLNGCGSRVMLDQGNVIYQNEIFHSKKDLGVSKAVPNNSTERPMAVNQTLSDRVIVECAYPLAGLHRLFSMYKFESEMAGFGRIVHNWLSMTEPQITTLKPTTALHTTPTTPATTSTREPGGASAFQPAFHPPVRYIKVSRVRNLDTMRRGPGRIPQTKVNLAN
ncbi:hypothetical protein JOB18_044709 [Solea senegalensis]|uniref:ZP domain-containing protein n=1 Tax=Solea senegalensis TaxID=28829 RepID=A0AAV6QXI1_SOLSE|nr:uncharacterized protein LOC122766692 [Solea senegalensis]KAG7497843.1 hypothetical protein JOB18_044709 [Solea senegalensis]